MPSEVSTVGAGRKEIAQDGAQILLVLDDKNAFAHVAPAAVAARRSTAMTRRGRSRHCPVLARSRSLP